MRKPALLTMILGGGLVAFDAHAQHEHEGHSPPSRSQLSSAQSPGFYLPEAMPLEPFTLVDQDAEPFTLRGLEGRWTLLVFGYTHCPDVCPITLAQVRDTRALLRHKAPAFDLGTVFVSIDPQRDTPSRVAPYVAAFDEELIGLTGSADAIADFADQFRVKYSVTGRLPEGYILGHTSSVALLTPQAELHALFSVPLRPEQLAEDLLAIARQDSRAVAHPDARDAAKGGG